MRKVSHVSSALGSLRLSSALVKALLLLTLYATAAFPDASKAIAGTQRQLTVTVDSVAVAPKFGAYVGGGANISPPAPMGGGGGIPLFSISNGAAFMAGEVSSQDANVKLIRITFTVRNTAPDATGFKIGDVGFSAGSENWTDFMAVGYGDQLCAMGDEDRKKVKEIAVEIQPGGTRQLSVIFPLSKTNAKQGQLLLGKAPPASFAITGS